MRVEELGSQIEEYLGGPGPVDVWEDGWLVARLLTRLWHRGGQERAALAGLERRLRERLERIKRKLAKTLSREQRQEREEAVLLGLTRTFEALVGDLALAPSEAHVRMARLREDVAALSWVIAGYPQEGEGLLAEAMAELSSMEKEQGQLEQELAGQGQEASLKALSASIVEIQHRMLLMQGASYLERAGHVLAREHEAGARRELEAALAAADGCWHLMLEGDLLRLTLRATIVREEGVYELSGLKALFGQLTQMVEGLRASLDSLFPEGEDDELRLWFAQHLQGVLDVVDEQLAGVDDVPLAEAIASLELVQEQLIWLLSASAFLRERRFFPKTTFDRMINQVHSLRRRVRNELQERKLQARLEGKFGRRAVAFSENLILWLILAVVGLLLLEGMFSLSVGVRFGLMWVDTVICAIFLLEFGTKLTLAEGKWLYFRRHFLIDFLPSIPFSFLIWVWNPQVLAASFASRGGRALRLVRVSRLARYVRVLRPVIRIFRLSSFLVRGMDRLLRKYETVFNRNIIFFSHPSEFSRQGNSTVLSDLRRLQERCRQRSQLFLHKMEPRARWGVVRQRVVVISELVGRYGHEGKSSGKSALAGKGDMSLDALVEGMLRMDTIQVEEVLGEDFVRQAERVLRFISAPGARHLPGLRGLAKARDEMDTPAVIAWTVRRLGSLLERIQSWIHWFGDFYGMVTGPQVLDRIGLAMINATLRPARRLLLFGLLFLLVTGLIQAFSIGALHNVSLFLGKYLGAPIIILGALSLVPLLLGFWFRMIAGEATDFFSRVSEAQFIGRLKQVKGLRREADLVQLLRRVLRPEEALKEDFTVPESEQFRHLLAHLEGLSVEKRSSELQPETHNPAASWTPQWHAQEQTLQLYEDYLDGTPLHRSDSKTTNQLLGNIAIQNIRKHRLALSLLEGLRIERLDLSRPRLLLYLGPYLWFASITESLSQRVARLIVEYNQNCIPTEELPWQSPAALQTYTAWKRRQKMKLAGRLVQEERKKKDEVPFRTTAFTALHFLSSQPLQDELIRETFGEDVLALLREERLVLTREVFSFYPFHLWSKESRTFNPYQMYQRYASSGRIFLLPLAILWWFLRTVFWAGRQVFHLVRDVLKPPTNAGDRRSGWADFAVAARQIHRMRKPVYMESLRLRALFDVEYLGLFLPGKTQSGMEGHTFTQDLHFIDALEKEFGEFRSLRSEREEQLRTLQAFWASVGWWDGRSLHQVSRVSRALTERYGEVLRACTNAYLVDYRKIRSLWESSVHLDAFFGSSFAQETPVGSLLRRWRAKATRTLQTFFFRREDREYKAYLASLSRLGYADRPKADRDKVWELYLTRRKELRPIMAQLAAFEDLRPPEEVLKETFEEVMRQHGIWTEEMLALRTLQTLTQLDIRLYRDLVYDLGNFALD